ncbi:MAG: ribbon-helix-helix domain-containing protein [Actinomycetota bacterium]|nr:ribbon-helix-helix domain-containing protein [Actinomycetota bacterium]
MAMRRFQMMIDDELDDALERRAAQEGVSKAELLREFARERLLVRPVQPDDPIWRLCGGAIGPDLVEDEYSGRVSEHVDEILYGSADPHPAGDGG